MSTRVCFRFGLLFALLVVLPFPFGVLPGTQAIAEQYSALWSSILPWAGEQLGVSDPARLQLIGYLVVAFAATVVWSLIDRDDGWQEVVAHATNTMIRFWIAAAMLDYGVGRCFAADPTTLATGVAACAAAGLLFWRRTATIGAFIAAAGALALLVPSYQGGDAIDLHTYEIAAGALALVAIDAPRLIKALLGYATRARFSPSQLSTPWLVVRWLAKAYLVGWIVFAYVDAQVTWMF